MLKFTSCFVILLLLARHCTAEVNVVGWWSGLHEKSLNAPVWISTDNTILSDCVIDGDSITVTFLPLSGPFSVEGSEGLHEMTFRGDNLAFEKNSYIHGLLESLKNGSAVIVGCAVGSTKAVLVVDRKARTGRDSEKLWRDAKEKKSRDVAGFIAIRFWLSSEICPGEALIKSGVKPLDENGNELNISWCIPKSGWSMNHFMDSHQAGPMKKELWDWFTEYYNRTTGTAVKELNVANAKGAAHDGKVSEAVGKSQTLFTPLPLSQGDVGMILKMKEHNLTGPVLFHFDVNTAQPCTLQESFTAIQTGSPSCMLDSMQLAFVMKKLVDPQQVSADRDQSFFPDAHAENVVLHVKNPLDGWAVPDVGLIDQGATATSAYRFSDVNSNRGNALGRLNGVLGGLSSVVRSPNLKDPVNISSNYVKVVREVLGNVTSRDTTSVCSNPSGLGPLSKMQTCLGSATVQLAPLVDAADYKMIPKMGVVFDRKVVTTLVGRMDKMEAERKIDRTRIANLTTRIANLTTQIANLTTQMEVDRNWTETQREIDRNWTNTQMAELTELLKAHGIEPKLPAVENFGASEKNSGKYIAREEKNSGSDSDGEEQNSGSDNNGDEQNSGSHNNGDEQTSGNEERFGTVHDGEL